MAAIDKLKKVPKSELYRFIVDGRLHASEKGWLKYAIREPNSLPAVFDAMQFSFSNLDQKDVTSQLIQNIHEHVATNVKRIASAAAKNPGKFRNTHGGFYLFDDFVNKEGFFEIFDLVNQELKDYGACLSAQPLSFLEYISSDQDYDSRLDRLTNTEETKEQLWEKIEQGDPVFYRAPRKEYVEKLLEKACVQYNKNIKEAKSEDDKLACIILLVQFVERIHGFPDCNGRASTVLLQRLLLQNDLLPTMLFNPNYIDGYGRSSFAREIKEGMQTTQQAIDDPQKPIYKYKTEKFPRYSPPDIFERENIATETFYVAEEKLFEFIQKLAPATPHQETQSLTMPEAIHKIGFFAESNTEKMKPSNLVENLLTLYSTGQKLHEEASNSTEETMKIQQRYMSKLSAAIPLMSNDERIKLKEGLKEYRIDKNSFLTESHWVQIDNLLSSAFENEPDQPSA